MIKQEIEKKDKTKLNISKKITILRKPTYLLCLKKFTIQMQLQPRNARFF
ncbi:hypothetical protein BH11BAC3_BH11BAC3_19210 [soil metagenome]